MTEFQTKTFLKHDDYITPKYAFENIAHLIPKDKIIWEPFYGDGTSGQYLKQLGFDVIHAKIDFFENDWGDIIVSNPPFSKSKEVLKRLKILNKPFIIILPVSKICTNYFREFIKDNEFPLQIIVPRKRIHFEKRIDGLPVEGWKPMCYFDCFYYCWKMDLPRDIIYLE